MLKRYNSEKKCLLDYLSKNEYEKLCDDVDKALVPLGKHHSIAQQD